MRALRHLDLSHNGFGDAGALGICMAILDVQQQPQGEYVDGCSGGGGNRNERS